MFVGICYSFDNILVNCYFRGIIIIFVGEKHYIIVIFVGKTSQCYCVSTLFFPFNIKASFFCFLVKFKVVVMVFAVMCSTFNNTSGKK